MSQTDEPPQNLYEDHPVPIDPEDIDTLRDALQTAIGVWEYSEERSDVVPDQWWELARLAEGLAIVARATSAYHEPLYAAHHENAKAAAEWETARWQSRWGQLQPRARNSAARLGTQTLSWPGVLDLLAADEELAATFQELIARFLTLRSSGQEPAGEQQP